MVGVAVDPELLLLEQAAMRLSAKSVASVRWIFIRVFPRVKFRE